MPEKNDIEIMILKKLDGLSSHEEDEFIRKWIAENEENKQLYKHIESTRMLFSRLNSMRRIDVNKARRRVKNQIRDFRTIPDLWLWLQRIAAVLFIPLLLSVGVYWAIKKPFQQKIIPSREIQSAYGVRTKFTLPDGSLVWLNSGSVLKYPERFTGLRREVFLYGEAYFDVARNRHSSFYVNLGELSVKATGTSFNVAAYPEENTFETTLISGYVNLVKTGADQKEIVVCHLKPNQHAIYSKEIKKIKLYEEDIKAKNEPLTTLPSGKPATLPNATDQLSLERENKYTSWIHGKLIFRNDPMDLVAKRLGRWYNAEIELKDSILYNFQYTATFTNETLEQVLELLALSTPIEYSFARKKEKEDNSFTKERVTIRLRPFNKK
jgi:transmembrane sensor